MRLRIFSSSSFWPDSCAAMSSRYRYSTSSLLIGSSIKVAPIVEWDAKPVGDGTPGPVARALRELLDQDMRSGRGRLIEVSY